MSISFSFEGPRHIHVSISFLFKERKKEIPKAKMWTQKTGNSSKI
jgi:hypothetical protein